MTLTENIADLGGARLSFAAFKRWMKDHLGSKDQLLPGLGLTQAQQFFLSMGQVWCATKSKADVVSSTLTDVHSNERLRINDVLKNLPEFADAYNCPKNSKMNPTKKCVLY